MMALVLIGVLAADPLTNVEERASTGVGLVGGLALASGMAPGANVGFMTGVRARFSRVSFGVEGSFFLPGQEEVQVAPSRYPRADVCHARCVEKVSSVAITGTLPVCVHAAWFSACAVGLGGAATSRSGTWQPVFSAGARVAIDPHLTESVSVYAALQVLGGIVRAQFDPWQAAPIQLGLTLGGTYEFL